MSIVLRMYVGSKRKQANKLYSSFDIEHLDQVDFRRIMACQRCLWHVNEDALEKLQVIWKLYTQDAGEEKSATLHKNYVQDIVTTCAVTEKGVSKMKTLLSAHTEKKWKMASFESGRNHLSFEEFLDGIHADNGAIVKEFDAQLEARLPEFLKSQAPHVGSWQPPQHHFAVSPKARSKRKTTVARGSTRATISHMAARKQYLL